MSNSHGTFAIHMADGNREYVRNRSGLTIEQFVEYLKKNGPLVRLNSKEVISLLNVTKITYDANYENSYPGAEI